MTDEHTAYEELARELAAARNTARDTPRPAGPS